LDSPPKEAEVDTSNRPYELLTEAMETPRNYNIDPNFDSNALLAQPNGINARDSITKSIEKLKLMDRVLREKIHTFNHIAKS